MDYWIIMPWLCIGSGASWWLGCVNHKILRLHNVTVKAMGHITFGPESRHCRFVEKNWGSWHPDTWQDISFQINCQVQNFQKFSRYLKSRLISLDKKTKAILTPKWLLGTWKVWWEFSPSNNIQLMPKDSTCWCGGLHDSKKLVKESQGPQHANNVFYLLIISYVFQGPLLRWSL